MVEQLAGPLLLIWLRCCFEIVIALVGMRALSTSYVLQDLP
jgi:hypothetical protein